MTKKAAQAVPMPRKRGLKLPRSLGKAASDVAQRSVAVRGQETRAAASNRHVVVVRRLPNDGLMSAKSGILRHPVVAGDVCAVYLAGRLPFTG